MGALNTRRIARSVERVLDGSREETAAAGDLHHLNLGPGPALEAEWLAAGLELPDLDAMRRYRLGRVTGQLAELGYDAAILMDPMNVRYVSDSTNMQVWVMHNSARYAFVGADGHLVVWDYAGCEFLSGHNDLIDEVRPAVGATYFLAGGRYPEKAQRWADEMVDLVTGRYGAGARVAIDQCHLLSLRAIERAGIEVGYGAEVMELARRIKGPDELRAMRCSIAGCQAAMSEMHERMSPGMTEREVWALLHEGNIRRAGEWIETQILSSGPRTNPWMQEASSRVIEPGDIVGYDTDLVGAYGMMTDISRTWIAGDRPPTPAQRDVYALAREQIDRNVELLTPGRTFRELTFDAWAPPIEEYRHYSALFHGVGQCDEYPYIVFPHLWDEVGFDGVLEPGMTLTVESFVGPRAGGEGVKLEDQVLVTDTGYEVLTDFPLDLVP